MIKIRQEAQDIIDGKQPKENNLLKNAPHPPQVIALSDKEWNKLVDGTGDETFSNKFEPFRPYSRQEAAYPLPWLLEKKFWPTVSRIDDGMYFANLGSIVEADFSPLSLW